MNSKKNNNNNNLKSTKTRLSRGHEVIIQWPIGKEDVYADTREIADESRPCTKCGQMPTSEGHDSCIGYVEGADYVCCGHGKEHGIIMLKNGRNIILVNDDCEKRIKKIDIYYED
ncbi:hypothetical protein [Methanobrevibacter filiformis]|uniref:Uncharacterized protein n=1 Tax=Methanobrevibacter filiformis TaxID=55758 RepID=A0A166BKM1_9EURY|nr:hypothetical protein [Methanobrevibacter filiformis]KZX13492.1 hypothetical protein MBFIL_10140 [Methanobrevibacter filiformis]